MRMFHIKIYLCVDNKTTMKVRSCILASYVSHTPRHAYVTSHSHSLHADTRDVALLRVIKSLAREYAYTIYATVANARSTPAAAGSLAGIVCFTYERRFREDEALLHTTVYA